MEIMILEKEGQKFEIPILQKQKNAFEERHGRGSLQRLYALLARDCNTFVEIGEMFGVTDERIRQIYQKRLALYLPKRNGRERRRACTLSRIHFAGSVKSFPKHVLKIWGKARRHGFSVSHVNHVYNRNDGELPVLTISKELLINGKLCKIYITHTYSQRQSDGPLYAHTTIAPMISPYTLAPGINPYAFLIVAVDIMVAPETYFLIPEEKFNNIIPYKNKRGYMVRSLNLPIGAKHNASNPWLTYENAWHLLA